MTPSPPFAPVFSRPCFLETIGVAEALRRLDDGLSTREPFLLVTGAPGIGKSALANEAIARWGSRIAAAYLAFPVSTCTELLEEILRRFGTAPPEGASRLRLAGCLESTLAEIAGRGQVAVIVVDDAHHLPPELLEELRLVVNTAQQARRPLEVLLAGLPELEAILDEPALAPLRQRVSVRARLEPLSPGETRRYIRHRIAAAGDDRTNLFPRKTCAEIWTWSGGVPRRINAVAAEALRIAREAGQPTVEPSHVRDAATALQGTLPKGEVGESEERDVPPTGTPPPAAAEPSAEAFMPPAGAAQASAPPVETPAPHVEAVPADASVDEDIVSAPAPPVSQDPHEWVARFLGDRGPVRISSRAMVGSSWAPRASRIESPGPQEPGATPAAHAERAGDAPSHPRPRRDGARTLATAALVTIAVAIVVVLGVRATRHAGRPADVTRAAAVDSTAEGEGTASSRAGDQTPRGAGADGGNARAGAAIPGGPYTLDAGARLSLDRALEERERLQALTGIETWVAPSSGSGSGRYRVLIGIFTRYARARSAANMLVRSRTLSHVTVVTLPPRDQRR